MAKQLMPKAAIESRPGDIYLTDEQYLNLSLFAKLKRKPSLDKYPGALVLRHYRQGEIIYRQGEAGWTAFYVLTTEDALALREPELEGARLGVWRGAPGEKASAVQQEVAGLRQRLERLQQPNPPPELRHVGKVSLAIPRSAPASFMLTRQFTQRTILGEMKPTEATSTVYRPMGAAALDEFGAISEPLAEGVLFGERSCLYRTPRPETVVAKRDCYVLEMLRHILDALLKDSAYKAQADEMSRRRDLQLHVRKLPLFTDLTDAQFRDIMDRLEIVSFEPGQVIFDEHDRTDDFFVIRNGLVKVLKNVTSLLRSAHVRSGKELCAALLAGEKEKTGPKAKVWQMLGDPARAAARTLATQDGQNFGGAPVLPALNEIIKSRQLPDSKEFKDLIDNPAFKERIRDLPEKRKEWSDLELRKCNRYLLEALYPDALGTGARSEGLACTLTHHSPGEFFGEQAILTKQARNTTSVADGHPNQYGLAQLVRIPGSVVRKMMELAPAIKKKVEAEAAVRRKQLLERLQVPVWDDTRQVQLSENFQELGLIQGQKLMLIDLDRCTRCDECVKACVATHDDGRSRLFLDGPRFGKYLVPLTCRSCLDPVCLMDCPVASIHRGDDRQIIIEDWCIGCGLCSTHCPYGSIQMHDIGIIAEGARGWRCLPASAVKQADWYRPRFRDHRWLPCAAPVVFDREFKESLARLLDHGSPVELVSPEQTFYFRHEFDLEKDPARAKTRFRVEITSAAKKVTLWVNGREVQPDKEQRGKREYFLPKSAGGDSGAVAAAAAAKPPAAVAAAAKPPAAATPSARVEPLWKQPSGLVPRVAPKPPAPKPPAPPPPPPAKRPEPGPHPFCKGRNVLAVCVEGTLAGGETLLQLRLDEVRKPSIPQDIASTIAQDLSEEITEKLVMERAVVCDLCSTLPSGPACVTACPHDAAIRVNARSNFPTK